MVSIRRKRQPTELAVGTGPDEAVQEAQPDRPGELRLASWWAVLRRTITEFNDDALSDRAAALTYYSIQSIFPALLVLVSLLGVIGRSATATILDNLQHLTPSSARDVVTNAVNGVRDSAGAGGVIAILGLAGAMWSASGYVAAFIRAANAVYDIPEGRPVWKIAPLRIAVTVALMLLLALSAVIVVFSGGVARQAGAALGFGQTAVEVWSYAKWPVLVVLVILMIAILYWAAPNVRHQGFRWLTPGSILALAIWMIASGAFAFYVANFGSYNKTYGALAGIIIFLVWLWLTNLAILLGLEFDAELARQRAIAGGYPPGAEPYTQPRDTRGFPRRPVRRKTRPATRGT
ncbi:YihY/virulence factor BrkB family protein [Frankia sp. CNm7]|uniref:YihY/virulence factor BrkB family protein n=1 Tax=Frankia nepalensis TaxID=1836974 RepID=A0A937RL17_9ACTN|nr:YihY/virulence factor BrkB family protein [Frankia nepalensis]MBL7498652.1 YihY/virulence factor BrkB family protein [Frankia nepalensis]MBL7509182.1 YihY/virulence factor BrkB family protein [Frankia nepalensis]MBL7522720.1 YihY/virulence factor BrkB family protein [Frankia nepalensis]MBL7628373.1 YihY/virulence factor BrkB family protein [Frankia nepalensis]